MNMLELENRIMQLRMDVNNYIAQAENPTNLEKLKMQAMQQDIQLLQSELNILKNQQTENERTAIHPQGQAIPQGQAAPQGQTFLQGQITPQQQVRPQQQYAQPQQAAPQTAAPQVQPQIPPRQPQPQPQAPYTNVTPGANQSPYANGTSYVNQQSYTNGVPYANRIPQGQAAPQGQTMPQQQIFPQQPYPQPQYQNKKAPDYEKFFGKAVMGIFASVLIFISMILFGTLIIPRLADVVKLAILYTASIGVSILGLFLIKKDKKNKLYQSVAGCGVGAVYISLFLSNLYFQVMDDLALYIGLFLWAALLCYLAKKQSFLFKIIGQLGIIIAALFGCLHYIILEEQLELILVLAFIVVTEIIYIAAFYKERAQLDVVQAGICLFGISYSFIHLTAATIAASPLFPPTGVIVPSCIVGLFLCANILYMTYTLENEEKNRISRNILMSLDLYLAWGLLGRYELLFAAATLIVFSCYMYKTSKYKLKFDIFSLFHAIAFLIAFQSVTLFDAGCLAAAAILLLFCGWHFDRLDLKIYGFFGLFTWLARLPIYYITGRETMAITSLLTGFLLCLLLSLIVFFHRKPNDARKKEDIALHITAYCFELLFLWRAVLTIGLLIENRFRTQIFTSDTLSWLQNTYTKLLFASFLAFLLNALCRQLLQNLAKKKTFDGKAYLITISIINIFFMLLGQFTVYRMNELMFLHIAAALFLTLTFLFNIKDVAKLRYGRLYIGIKLLVLMLILLDTFRAANYFVSICCFAFACISIFVGFKIQFKPVRLFGLVLSCIAAAKLILLDLHYTSSALKAASFFICGVICFLIALIYNVVDKKQGS